jgi:predicted nucleic acid-binding protein
VIAAVDSTFLTLLLNEQATPRPNPATGIPVQYPRERIESLIDEIAAKNGTLIVPTPALAEVLCILDAPEDYVNELQNRACIRVAAFDTRAAITFSRLIRAAKAQGDKRSGVAGPWQNLKMDRQIVSIAKTNGATIFYSDDDNQAAFASLAGLEIRHSWDLTLSPGRAQRHLAGDDEAWPRRRKSSD